MKIKKIKIMTIIKKVRIKIKIKITPKMIINKIIKKRKKIIIIMNWKIFKNLLI
jgi:hypothetical protein